MLKYIRLAADSNYMSVVQAPVSLRDAEFVEQQSSWLSAALCVDAPPRLISVVLTAHDAAHHRWIALIAKERADRPELAGQLAELYALHGQLAAQLERGTDARLNAKVLSRLYRHRQETLQRRTRDVLSALG